MKNDNINDFLSGNMDDNEHENFQNELRDNEELLKKVGNEVINEYGRIKLKSKLNTIDKEINSSNRMFKTYMIAAIMVLALGIPLVMNMISGGIATEKLFAQHFSPYQTVSAVRGNETGDEFLSKGILAYSNGNFELAINNLEEIKEKTYVVNFYLGVSYLGVNPPKGEEAILNLEKVLTVDNDFHQQATWYKGLALLVTKKKQEAKKIFETIKLNKWFNHEKAIEILEGM